jgi:hypothetical protein
MLAGRRMDAEDTGSVPPRSRGVTKVVSSKESICHMLKKILKYIKEIQNLSLWYSQQSTFDLISSTNVSLPGIKWIGKIQVRYVSFFRFTLFLGQAANKF